MPTRRSDEDPAAKLDVAIADFGDAYAAQSDVDYAAMQQAAQDGRIEVAEVF